MQDDTIKPTGPNYIPQDNRPTLESQIDDWEASINPGRLKKIALAAQDVGSYLIREAIPDAVNSAVHPFERAKEAESGLDMALAYTGAGLSMGIAALSGIGAVATGGILGAAALGGLTYGGIKATQGALSAGSRTAAYAFGQAAVKEKEHENKTRANIAANLSMASSTVGYSAASLATGNLATGTALFGLIGAAKYAELSTQKKTGNINQLVNTTARVIGTGAKLAALANMGKTALNSGQFFIQKYSFLGTGEEYGLVEKFEDPGKLKLNDGEHDQGQFHANNSWERIDDNTIKVNFGKSREELNLFGSTSQELRENNVTAYIISDETGDHTVINGGSDNSVDGVIGVLGGSPDMDDVISALEQGKQIYAAKIEVTKEEGIVAYFDGVDESDFAVAGLGLIDDVNQIEVGGRLQYLPHIYRYDSLVIEDTYPIQITESQGVSLSSANNDSVVFDDFTSGYERNLAPFFFRANNPGHHGGFEHTLNYNTNAEGVVIFEDKNSNMKWDPGETAVGIGKADSSGNVSVDVDLSEYRLGDLVQAAGNFEEHNGQITKFLATDTVALEATSRVNGWNLTENYSAPSTASKVSSGSAGSASADNQIIMNEIDLSDSTVFDEYDVLLQTSQYDGSETSSDSARPLHHQGFSLVQKGENMEMVIPGTEWDNPEKKLIIGWQTRDDNTRFEPGIAEDHQIYVINQSDLNISPDGNYHVSVPKAGYGEFIFGVPVVSGDQIKSIDEITFYQCTQQSQQPVTPPTPPIDHHPNHEVEEKWLGEHTYWPLMEPGNLGEMFPLDNNGKFIPVGFDIEPVFWQDGDNIPDTYRMNVKFSGNPNLSPFDPFDNYVLAAPLVESIAQESHMGEIIHPWEVYLHQPIASDGSVFLDFTPEDFVATMNYHGMGDHLPEFGIDDPSKYSGGNPYIFVPGLMAWGDQSFYQGPMRLGSEARLQELMQLPHPDSVSGGLFAGYNLGNRINFVPPDQKMLDILDETLLFDPATDTVKARIESYHNPTNWELTDLFDRRVFAVIEETDGFAGFSQGDRIVDWLFMGSRPGAREVKITDIKNFNPEREAYIAVGAGVLGPESTISHMQVHDWEKIN
ncbi:hypothetical protein GF327_06685 [Candidatus Woesearchaeota archaeon]|nr:hypothetical protein [Candidatus Woesearchaeota archaeon]